MSRATNIERLEESEELRDRLAKLVAANEQLKRQLAVLQRTDSGSDWLTRLQLADIVDSANDPVMAVNGEGRISYWNCAAERLFGYSSEEIAGQHIALLAGDEFRKEQQHILSTIQRGERIGNLETVRIAKDGRLIDVSITVSPVIDEAGAHVGFSAIVRDISDRKRIEEARREAEQSLHESNRILAAIHELQSEFIADAPANVVFESLLCSLLTISESQYGFIGEVLRTESDAPYLKTHAISNIAWNEETRRFFEENAPDGLEFFNMETLFGCVITTGEAVIANSPAQDPRSNGVPAGHPALDAFLGIPLYSRGELVGMAGLANRQGGYDQNLIDVLAPLWSVCASLVTAYRSERERKQAAFALQESESRFRALIENSFDVICLFSAEGKLVYTSPSMKRVLGYDPEELIGTKGPALVHPDDIEDSVRRFTAFIEKPNATALFSHRVRHKNGTYRTVEVTGTNLLHEPGVNAMVSIFRDVTDRRRAEERLKQSERRYRTLIQNAPDAIMVFDPEQERFVDVNDNAISLFGYSRDEFLAMHPRHISMSIQPDGRRFDEHFKGMLPKLLAGEQVTFEWFHLRADGTNFPSEVRLMAFPSASGRRIRSSVVDITHRKRQEELLRAQEQALAHVSRLSTLGEMVAGIAHEINQPLSAISNFAAACNNVVNTVEVPAAPMSQWLQQISEQAVRCGDIIRRLRDFVKKNDEERDSLNLNEVTRESVALIDPDLRRNRVTVVCKLDESIPDVHANRIQIEQVIVNLLRNAYEAICHQNSTDRTIELSSEASRESVRLTVEDHGPGIQEQDIDRLFDAFYTTKPHGMGMGLAISRSIIEAHGGRLWIDTGGSCGARFHVELPQLSEVSKADAKQDSPRR